MDKDLETIVLRIVMGILFVGYIGSWFYDLQMAAVFTFFIVLFLLIQPSK